MNNTEPKREINLLNIKIDKDLHRIFKIWCINHETTMAAFIISYIERIMSNHNPELTPTDQFKLKKYLNSKRGRS